jgi:hypothetical protein
MCVSTHAICIRVGCYRICVKIKQKTNMRELAGRPALTGTVLHRLYEGGRWLCDTDSVLQKLPSGKALTCRWKNVYCLPYRKFMLELLEQSTSYIFRDIINIHRRVAGKHITRSSNYYLLNPSSSLNCIVDLQITYCRPPYFTRAFKTSKKQ